MDAAGHVYVCVIDRQYHKYHNAVRLVIAIFWTIFYLQAPAVERILSSCSSLQLRWIIWNLLQHCLMAAVQGADPGTLRSCPPYSPPHIHKVCHFKNGFRILEILAALCRDISLQHFHFCCLISCATKGKSGPGICIFYSFQCHRHHVCNK